MRSVKITVSIALIGLFAVVFFGGITAYAGENRTSSENEDPVYYFWGYCPTCSKPDQHIGLFDDYPVEVEIYEVFLDVKGRNKYDQVSEELGIDVRGFPTIVYKDQFWLGFSETVQEEIIEAIEASLEDREAAERKNIYNLPLFGEVDLADSPILLTTVIVAFLDGFNPCSLFVLTFLLAIIVHSASRKRIFIVGITFLLVTSAVYGLFILGVLNIMVFAAQLFWIRNLIAAIVIILGLVAIKDFIVYKQGFSLSIPESYKNRYYQQVRKLFYTKSVLPMIAATAMIALGIALIELPCTAGFPFIWSSIVAGLDLPFSVFFVLFVIYIITYLSVELVIFGLAVIRMRSIKMTEERGRLLKLVAGSLMMVLGLILFIDPAYMERMSGIAVAFAASAGLAVTIYLIRKAFVYYSKDIKSRQ